MAKKSEMASMTVAELNKKEADLRRERFNLKLQLAIGQLEDTAAIGRTRRDLARTLTYKNQKLSAEKSK